MLLNNDVVVTPHWLGGCSNASKAMAASALSARTNNISGIQKFREHPTEILPSLTPILKNSKPLQNRRIPIRIVGFCMLFSKAN
jgi:hypothetical protein